MWRITKVFKVHVYYGDGREKTHANGVLNIESLTRHHDVFGGDCPGQNVIITSYNTAVQRNGLKAQRGWMLLSNIPVDENENVLPEPDVRWDRCLTGKVGILPA